MREQKNRGNHQFVIIFSKPYYIQTVFKLILSAKLNSLSCDMSSSVKVTYLLLLIFFQCVFGYAYITQELSCPETDYKLRDKAYMKLEEKSGEFCISCYYTRGGPVNKSE